MSHVLHNGGIQELLDLVDWLETHAEEPDTPAGAVEAAEWLGDVDMGQTVIDVPAQHVAALSWAIDDWVEVLSAHNEGLETRIAERAPCL